MRTGILTFHRAHNYGAVLQCYALQESLCRLGYKTEVIDYRQPWVESYYRPFSLRRFLHISTIGKKLRYAIHAVSRLRPYIRKKAYYSRFITKHLHLSDRCKRHIPDIYNCYVIGSDQLWSESCLGDKFDSVYLGDFLKEKKKIGYAISTNSKSLQNIIDNHLDQLDNFTAISFREETVAESLTAATGKSFQVCLDPTLLLTREDWARIADEKFKGIDYIAVYQVRAPYGRNIILQKAKKLAAKYGCQIIDLSNGDYSVEEFIGVIKNARCVLTSSFHATVFSILFNTPFYSFRLNDGKDGRYESLLYAIGLSNNLLDISENPDTIETRELDNSLERLEILRNTSIHFLKNAISS